LAVRLVTLEQVESQLARGFGLLRFAPEIETLFLRQYAAERARLVATWCLIGVLIYDLVYFADRDIVPDVRTGLIVVRFLIFTPFVIACIFVVRRWPNARLYDTPMRQNSLRISISVSVNRRAIDPEMPRMRAAIGPKK
jgi:hypothetical protein